MSTVILGIGNEFCADDGVGLAVAAALADQGLPAIAAGCPGLGLLDLLAGYDQAVLVDAVVSGAPPGSVHQFRLDDLPDPALLPISLHGVGVVDALRMGQIVAPSRLPAEVIIIGVEIADRRRFVRGLSPAVASAVPQAVAAVREAVAKMRLSCLV